MFYYLYKCVEFLVNNYFVFKIIINKTSNNSFGNKQINYNKCLFITKKLNANKNQKK